MSFVCIRSFDNYLEARIVLHRLQDENINCYLENENTVILGPFLSNSIGGIRLMVIEQHAERALSILKETDERDD